MLFSDQIGGITHYDSGIVTCHEEEIIHFGLFREIKGEVMVLIVDTWNYTILTCCFRLHVSSVTDTCNGNVCTSNSRSAPFYGLVEPPRQKTLASHELGGGMNIHGGISRRPPWGLNKIQC